MAKRQRLEKRVGGEAGPLWSPGPAIELLLCCQLHLSGGAAACSLVWTGTRTWAFCPQIKPCFNQIGS